MFDHLDSAQKRLYFALMANFIALGISMTIFGATVPQIIDGFGWDYISTGIVMSAGACGGFLSALACGALLRRIKPKFLLAIGLAILSLSLILFGKVPSAFVNGGINFLMGFGSCFSEVITNASVVRMEKPGESRLMNLMHASFCVGAAIGPMAVGALAAVRIPFGAVYTGAGLFQIIIIGVLLFQAFPRMEAKDDTGKSGNSGSKAAGATPWKSPLFWALIGAMFLYVGVELTYSSWIAEFSARHRSFSAVLAPWTVTVYWIGLLLGRLLLSFRYKGKRQELMLAALATLSVVFYALTAAFPAARGEQSPPAAQALTWACAFLTGLCFSGCYPIIASIVGAEFKGSTTALGVCSSAAGIGTLLFPMGTGTLASAIGLPRAMLAAAGVDACLAACAIVISLKRKAAARAIDSA